MFSYATNHLGGRIGENCEAISFRMPQTIQEEQQVRSNMFLYATNHLGGTIGGNCEAIQDVLKNKGYPNHPKSRTICLKFHKSLRNAGISLGRGEPQLENILSSKLLLIKGLLFKLQEVTTFFPHNILSIGLYSNTSSLLQIQEKLGYKTMVVSMVMTIQVMQLK